jgi:glycosyltransferase involved in cell wall biosynthesis
MALISAFIIAQNEEQRIARAIVSLQRLVDEIIVIDSGSTDNTVKISEELGARVVYNKWPGYVEQKIFGEKLCKHQWVLNIDADEELTSALQDEIIAIFKSNIEDRYKAYRINFLIMHRKDATPRMMAPNNTFIRLYNTKYASFGNESKSTTHDAVLLNPGYVEKDNVYIFNYPALHYSGTSIEQLVAKANFYSSEQASDIVKSGRKITQIRIISEFFLWFFKAFLIRRYFVFGFDGFVDSMIFAFARFLRLAKAREKQKNDKE